MKRDIEKTLLLLKKITLTSRERDAVRLRIRQAFTITPVTFSETARHHRGKNIAPLYTFFVNVKHNRMAPIALGLIMALSLGGSVTLAAEQSLPGDTLYPVKVSVNEEIRGAFTFSDEARADFEAKRAERRLEEASRLSKEGRLNAQTRVDLETRLSGHIRDVDARVAKLKARGRDSNSSTVEARLESSLNTYAYTLSDVDTDVSVATSSKLETRTLVKTIKEKVLRAQERRQRASDDTRASNGNEENSSSSPEQRAHEDSIRSETEDDIRVHIEGGEPDSQNSGEIEDSVKIEGTVKGGVRFPF